MNYYDHQLYKKELIQIIEKNPSIAKLKQKSIVITGARGLIGSMIIDSIMQANHMFNLDCHVYAIGRDMRKLKERFIQYENDEQLHLIQADVNKNEIRIEQNIDYFIHGASNTHPRYYASQPIETIRTNTIGTDRTLQFAFQHECQKYIFLSSVEIYGENRGDVERFTEDYCGYIDCNTLRSGYPESKRVGESLCQAYRKEKGGECVIARLARCYGAGLLPEDSKALTQFLRKATNGEDIVLKSEGEQYYSYVYVADAVDAILFLLTKGKDGEAYNIVGKDSDIRLRELAGFIAKKIGKNVVFDLPDQSELEGYSRATKALLDDNKLMALGWKPKQSLLKNLEHTISILTDKNWMACE